MTYIEWLSPEEFKACLRHVVEADKKYHPNPTKTKVQLSNYLLYLEGKTNKENICGYGWFSEADLINLKVHGFIIDIYMRMVDDLTKENL